MNFDTLALSGLAAALVFAFVVAYAWEVARLVRLGSRYEATILADSISAVTLSRLTSMLLTYPRFVHAEFMTHRTHARNASSSRALPSAKLRAAIFARMALPAVWGQNRPGMQAGADVSRVVFWIGVTLWIACGHVALITSALLDRLGVHKQIVNRIVEPWSHITVVTTAEGAGWANFYALRVHPDADPTMQKIASAALTAHRESTPRGLQPGEWHLPFVSKRELADVGERGSNALVRASVARAARTSFLNHDGTAPNLGKDLALYVRLVGATPKHASPTEHQARALSREELTKGMGWLAGCFGPNSGWCQHRKEIPDESANDLGRFLAST